jgi:hypothetical protein
MAPRPLCNDIEDVPSFLKNVLRQLSDQARAGFATSCPVGSRSSLGSGEGRGEGILAPGGAIGDG